MIPNLASFFLWEQERFWMLLWGFRSSLCWNLRSRLCGKLLSKCLFWNLIISQSSQHPIPKVSRSWARHSRYLPPEQGTRSMRVERESFRARNSLFCLCRTFDTWEQWLLPEAKKIYHTVLIYIKPLSFMKHVWLFFNSWRTPDFG